MRKLPCFVLLIAVVLLGASAAYADFLNPSFENKNFLVDDSRIDGPTNSLFSGDIDWMTFDPSDIDGDAPNTGNGAIPPYNALANWTVFGSMDWKSSPRPGGETLGYWQASDGLLSLDLNCTFGGGIYQVVDTTPGAEYVVSFDLSGNPFNDPVDTNPREMQVAALNGVQTPTTGTPTPGLNQSQDYSFDASVLADYSNGDPIDDMQWSAQTFTFTAADSQTTIVLRSLLAEGRAGAAVDNVHITPEPGTVVLALISLGGLLGIRRRGRAKQGADS